MTISINKISNSSLNGTGTNSERVAPARSPMEQQSRLSPNPEAAELKKEISMVIRKFYSSAATGVNQRDEHTKKTLL